MEDVSNIAYSLGDFTFFFSSEFNKKAFMIDLLDYKIYIKIKIYNLTQSINYAENLSPVLLYYHTEKKIFRIIYKGKEFTSMNGFDLFPLLRAKAE